LIFAGGVHRAFRPGCKFDEVPILIGEKQGEGKSTFIKWLAMQDDFFNDNISDFDSQKGIEALQGKWIVELGELSGLKKAENETVKQFLSCRKDTYRPAYGRYAMDFPRQCIFLGSTNDREFITDETGGRRFWPVEIHASPESTSERMIALGIARDLLWAEAMALYRRGEKTWLSTAVEIAAGEQEQQRFAQQDEWAGLVRAYLERTLPPNWEKMKPEARREFIRSGERGEIPRRRVSIAEIRYELLGEEVKGANASSRRLGKIMNVMEEWKLVGVRETVFGKQKVYEKTTDNRNNRVFL
jgi:predicted P-loop ATPase